MTQTVHPLFEKGVAALGGGHLAEAKDLFQQVLKTEPDNAAACFNLGLIHFQNDNGGEAEACLRKAYVLRPGHQDTQAMLAAVLVQAGQLAEAVGLARQLVASNPSQANLLHSAGQVLAAAGWTDEGEAAHQRALAQDPTYRPAAWALVNLLLARRGFAQAVTVCDAALHNSPTDQEFHLKRAQALWEDGQTAPARDALRNIVDFAPDNITAHYNLSLFADHEDAQTTIDRLAVLLSENVQSTDDTIKAWFTLGNLFAGKEESESALACFQAGNETRATHATTVHSLSADAFDVRVKALVGSPLPAYEPREAQGPTPLIIVGPSRSGKSLLQSWLSGHPDIDAADETGVLPHLAESDLGSDPPSLEAAATAYRKALMKLGGAKGFVIDTHPVNALYLDLLHKICPDAVVVQISRNPLDVAVSTFARHYVTGGHWADTWRGIARRMSGYDCLRDHWAPWGPVKATVDYETLVQEPGPTLRHIIESLGLSWTDEVLPPESRADAARAMPWASFPGRSEAGTHSIDLWRPFAPWLGEFASAYGRELLSSDDSIPDTSAQPSSPWVTGLKRIGDGKAEPDALPETLVLLPAVQAQLADTKDTEQDWDSALKHRWQAVNHRPFTHRVRHHTEQLKSTLAQSPSHQTLADLHKRVDAAWDTYRQASDLRFGDFGVLYQSCADAFLSGSRCTATRAEAYGLDSLVANRTVLDLGCNVGFLALEAAKTATHVQGIEKHDVLVDIGQQVSRYLDRSNTRFTTADLSHFVPEDSYDVVIAAAVHGWLEQPLEMFVNLLAKCTAPQGAVLFESQGRRSTSAIEEGFVETVATIASAGFKIEREGTVCDDLINLRAFAILRKTD